MQSVFDVVQTPLRNAMVGQSKRAKQVVDEKILPLRKEPGSTKYYYPAPYLVCWATARVDQLRTTVPQQSASKTGIGTRASLHLVHPGDRTMTMRMVKSLIIDDPS